MLRTRVSTTREFCLMEDLEVYKLGGTMLVIFEYYIRKFDTWYFHLNKFCLIKGLGV